MTKEKFAAQLAKEMRAGGLKINADNAEKLIVAISQSMAEGLARDAKLIVSNFGSFEVVKYGAKMISSPRGDNKQFFMPPTNVIKWHPSGKIRERAISSEVAEEEYQQLKGNPVEEEIEPRTIFQPTPEQPVAISTAEKTNNDPYEVKVTFVGKSNSHLSDDNSPISKFVRSIFSLMKTFSADKLEITPSKTDTKILYYSSGETKNQRLLPKDSHKIIVDKIEALAGPSNELLLFGTDRIKLTRKLTQFGDQLIVQRI